MLASQDTWMESAGFQRAKIEVKQQCETIMLTHLLRRGRDYLFCEEIIFDEIGADQLQLLDLALRFVFTSFVFTESVELGL